MASNRLEVLDALRGLAMLWMTLYHFCFDLNYFGLWRQDFYADPFWTWQRTLIVSLFLFCAGFAQAWGHAHGQSAQRFWRRWAQVAACAALVSLGSWLMFSQSWIYFGILHGIAIMLILLRWSLSWGHWLWLASVAALLSKPVFEALADQVLSVGVVGWMNSPALNWLGLITQKPITEDYAPVLPWLAVMWWGAASAQWLIRSNRLAWLAAMRPWPWLSALGRWSLSYYMLHQPVLLGSLAGLVWLLTRT